MNRAEILDMFHSAGALLKGHFKLSSGFHSGRYLQCALLLQYPQYAEKLCTKIAEYFKDDNISVVVGPAIGGIIVSLEVARALSARSIFTERENGKVAMRRGFNVDKNDNVLIVEDVVTTGLSTKETIKAVKEKGARIAGVGALIDRSNGVDFSAKFAALIKINIPTFEASNCPLCAKKIPITKPGSRIQ